MLHYLETHWKLRFWWIRAFVPETWSSWGLFGAAIWAGRLALRTLTAIEKQAEEMLRQNQNMVKKERARLSIEFSWDGFVMPDQWELQGELSIEFSISISNHGPTKAFNVSGHGIAMISPNTDPPAMELAKTLYVETVIESGKNISVNIPTEIRVSDTDSIRSEDAFMHLFGFATYTDIFDAEHKTSFRYLWKDLTFDVEGQVIDDSGWITWGPTNDNLAV